MNKIHSDGSTPKFFAIDFFCGAGGTTRGLIDAGAYVVAGIDKDIDCQETYLKNNPNRYWNQRPPEFLQLDIFPKSSRYQSGQQKVLFAELERVYKHAKAIDSHIPWLFAICAPCQPFTKLSKKTLTAKRQLSRRRDKNLLGEALKFVRHFKPELILSENVQGIGDGKFGGVWSRLKKDLVKLGYVTGSKVVCCSRFGIPQFRKRSILLAVRKDVVIKDRFADMDETTLLVPESDPNTVMVSVREAIGHLPPIKAGEEHYHIPNHCARSLSEINLMRLTAAKPGQSNLYLKNTPHGDLSLQCHRKVKKRLGTDCFTDVYTRMHPDRPSPTITTRCHSISNGRYGHYDLKQVRGISLREAAILQSFPESYIFYSKYKSEPVSRMIGNAVPPKLAEFYSRYLVRSVST